MDYNIKDLQEVEKYIRGKLQPKQIDALWVKFLQDPKLFSYFETELHIRSLIKDVQAGRTSPPFKCESNSPGE